MQLRLIGLNHDTAPVGVRGKLAFAPDEQGQALQSLVSTQGVEEAVILSTCNRTELYVVGDMEQARGWLHGFKGVAHEELNSCLYSLEGSEAARHLMRVAAGLNSMILGEPQILGQVKDAYAIASEAGTVSSGLQYSFQQAFSVAKDVRTHTAVGASAVSVAYAAVQLSRHIFTDVSKATCLLIGAGEMIELVASHLRELGVKDMVVANRTIDRAKSLAGKFNGKAIALEDLHDEMAAADMVFSSTAATLPIVGKGTVESAMRQRKYKPMLFVDMVVPRDIEEEVAGIEEVFLYTVDDLRDVVEENRKARQEAAEEAEEIIERHVLRLEAESRQAAGVDVVKEYRQHLESLRLEFQQKAEQELHKGGDAAEVFERLTRQMMNKVSHQPTMALKKASESHRHDLLLWAQELLTDSEKNEK